MCWTQANSVILVQGTLNEGDGCLSTIDLLVLTSLDQLQYNTDNIIFFLTKTYNLKKEVNCTEPSPSDSVPCLD